MKGQLGRKKPRSFKASLTIHGIIVLALGIYIAWSRGVIHWFINLF